MTTKEGQAATAVFKEFALPILCKIGKSLNAVLEVQKNLLLDNGRCLSQTSTSTESSRNVLFTTNSSIDASSISSGIETTNSECS